MTEREVSRFFMFLSEDSKEFYDPANWLSEKEAVKELSG